MNAGFTRVRWQDGYDIAEVDAFVDRVVRTLTGSTDRPLTADEIRSVAFSPVRFRTGYSVVEVDEFLADAVSRLDPR